MREWAKRHPLTINLTVTLLVVVPGYLRLEGIVNQACEDRRNGRIILRELVELSDDGRGGFNLTGIESFNDLDPDTQRYLTDLEEASKQSPNPSQFVKNALALLDVPDC